MVKGGLKTRTPHSLCRGHDCRELWGKTVGLVGFGAVGRAVAKRLEPFGVDVLVFDPFVTGGAVAAPMAREVMGTWLETTN